MIKYKLMKKPTTTTTKKALVKERLSVRICRHKRGTAPPLSGKKQSTPEIMKHKHAARFALPEKGNENPFGRRAGG